MSTVGAFKQSARAGSLLWFHCTKPAVLPHDSLQFLVFLCKLLKLAHNFLWIWLAARKNSTYNVKKGFVPEAAKSCPATALTSSSLPAPKTLRTMDWPGSCSAWTRCIVVFFSTLSVSFQSIHQCCAQLNIG